ncbi:MAG: hypothetical protein HMLIMOIP_000887 [Candidatus Nitrosomirales archaeon]|jgi:hypothetical protein
MGHKGTVRILAFALLFLNIFLGSGQPFYANNFFSSLLLNQIVYADEEEPSDPVKQSPSLEGSVVHQNELIQTRVGEGFSKIFCFPRGAADPSEGFCSDVGQNHLFLLDIGISRDGNVRTVSKGDLTNVEDLASFLVNTPPTLQRSQAVYKDAEGLVRITQVAETVSGTKYVVYALHATNIGTSAINDFRIGAYTDWEAAESSEEDRAKYDALTDTAFQFENAGGLHVGISSPTHTSSHHLDTCCDDASPVLSAPNNINNVGVDDVTVSLAWNLGSLSPGETKTVHLILAAGTNLDDLNSEISDAKASLMSSIGGKKFHDLNANGIDDNEPGLEGWTIHLSGQSSASIVTGPGGFYQFNGLLPGTYFVCEVLVDQSDFIQSSPTNGHNCTGDDEAPLGHVVDLQGEQIVTGINFGNFKNATIEGDKFEDLDADGFRDQTEPLVSGIKITLAGTDGMSNAVDMTINTDDKGHYKFEVRPGSYTICEDLLNSPNGADFFQSFPSIDSNCSTAAPKGYLLNPQSGDSMTAKDFGNYKNAVVEGDKFQDLDRDGTAREQDEPLIPGTLVEFSVRITGTDGIGNSASQAMTQDANGHYRFEVRPGADYKVCEINPLPEKWFRSFPSIESDTDCHIIGALSSGQSVTDKDFGNFEAIVLGFTEVAEGIFEASSDVGQVGAGTTLGLVLEAPPSPLNAQLDEILIPIGVEGDAGTLTLTLSEQTPTDVPPPPADVVALFFNLKFDGGINFDDPNSFGGNATIKVLVNKNIDADRLEGDASNCLELNVFVLNDSTNVWEPALSVERDENNDVGTDTANTDDDKCGYLVTHNHTSRFSVGGIKRPSGGNGGYDSVVVDHKGPSIESYYYKPDVVRDGDTIKVRAQIIDDVAVTKAVIFYYNSEQNEHDGVSASMVKINAQWFEADIPAATPGIKYWIHAQDASGNSARIEVQTIPVGESNTSTSSRKPLFTVIPKDTAQKVFEVSATNGIGFSGITIKNLDDKPLENVRIILSPGLHKKLFPSEYAIKSIGPNSEKHVDLKLIGRPSTDPDGNMMRYSGQIIIATANNDLAVLELDASQEDSSHKSAFLDAVASKADMRYRKVNAQSLNLDLIKSNIFKAPQEYEIKSSDGKKSIDNLSDNLVIKNYGDKPLKNVRIFLSSVGKHFLPSQQNIPFIAPDSEFTVSLVSKLYADSGYLRGYKGELVIVPENSVPMTIPVDLPARAAKEDPMTIRLMNDGNAINAAFDSISIKNDGENVINDVRFVLSQNLARLFSLSSNSLKHIEAGDEHMVDIMLRDPNSIVNNHEGQLLIVSPNHEVKIVPINIVWKDVSSQHFTIYVRENSQYVDRAKALSEFLESNYATIAERFGKSNTKTVLYMLNSMDEMKIVAGGSTHYYDYDRDIAFVCGCSDDAKIESLYGFAYRTIINNNPSYWNKQKILFDDGNWLLDSITRYVVARTMEEQTMNMVNTVVANDILEWYGESSESKHIASYGFITFLEEKYGEEIIDKTLGYLGSGMISNHRCDTLENCSVLRAVYDASGLDMDNKRYDLSFTTLVEEWEGHVSEQYDTDNSENVYGDSQQVLG